MTRRLLPGSSNGTSRLKCCWTFGGGADPSFPSFAPEVSFAKVAAPKAPASATCVLRVKAFKKFSEDVAAVAKLPGRHFRAWAARLGQQTLREIVDSWGWQARGDFEISGLVRVKTSVARTFLEASGAQYGTCAWFVEPLNWDDLSVPRPALHWLSSEEGESPFDLLRRARGMANSFGLVAGAKQVAIRIDQLDPRRTPSTHKWIAEQVPRDWDCEAVCQVLEEVGFEQVELDGKLPGRRGTAWQFMALRKDFRSFVPVMVEDP